MRLWHTCILCTIQTVVLLCIGFIGGLLEVPGESSHLKTEPAGLRQARLQGNGVLGDTELCAQVRIRHIKSTMPVQE